MSTSQRKYISTGMLVVLWSLCHGGCRQRQASPATIAAASAAYLKSEGHLNRGPLFLDLVLTMDSPAIPGKNVTGNKFNRKAIERLLGPPDLIEANSETPDYLYYHDRFGENDWFVWVYFLPGDPFAEFAYNASSEIDMMMWKELGEVKGTRPEK